MRDIKFRAWDTKYFEFLDPEDITMTLDGILLIDGNGSILKSDEVIVEQYTGIKDKNGVEIYENDVISALVYGFQEKGIVEYSPFGEWLFGNIRLNEFMSSLTVIGNIHENADLLED